MVRLRPAPPPQSVEVRFGFGRAGAVGVPLPTTASVDAVIPARPEVDRKQLRRVRKRPPVAALRQTAPA
ncbi:hypothetical protein [Streptomyces sp. AM 2-1-1]|uniref:hypothetical protein n=1 Tax=Streptomyces sp. AM 2-1-1 TaxID=3028709 RepID=UPI0023BA22B5|nr:hypothetical protein [Streptomyces sp. AM 2-1-1]WEH43510.1 hypothetical protein PZB77_00090 [Streptomyces sp. AM 2-1-1]